LAKVDNSATGLRYLPICVVVIAALLVTTPSAGQSAPSSPGGDESGLTNATEFSAVATYGNSKVATIGLGHEVRYAWTKGRVTARVEVLRSTKARKRFVELAPGPGGLDEGFTLRLSNPERTLDAERYLVQGAFDRRLTERLFWNLGTSWDRNGNAGIRSRYRLHAGVGQVWLDRDRSRFESTYGLSYTDREEGRPDPAKDRRFPGARLAYAYRHAWGDSTVLRHEASVDVNLQDGHDWSSDALLALDVGLGAHLALRVSSTWLYSARPALDSIDVLTLLPGGAEIDFGSIEVPRETLDTFLTSSIVLDF